MDTKVFTIEYDGLKLEITATNNGDGTVSFSVKCLEGYADINALYWSDGDATAGEGSMDGFDAKSDKSLNMNGTDVAWDGGVKLSSAGLGSEGEDKDTFLTEGETKSFGPFSINWDDLDTLGVRATSTSNAEGSIKGVATAEEPEEPEEPQDHFPEWPQDISHITLYFQTDESCDTNGDGVYTVKIDTPAAFPDDLDDSIDTILNWIVANDECVDDASQLLGVAIKGGVVEERYFAMDGDINPDPLPAGLTELVQNKDVDQTYEYNDVFAA
jgi:hypothetical protein